MWLMLSTLLFSVDIPYDGIDQDGDGYDVVDVDGDGFSSELAGGSDCNDRDANVHPGAIEIPDDEIEQDCGQPLVPQALGWANPWKTDEGTAD